MPIEDLTRDEGFRAALIAGAVAVAAVGGLGIALRHSIRGALLPAAGIAIVLAALLGLDREARVGSGWTRLVLALIVLAAGGLATAVWHWPLLVAVLAAAPGAALLASTPAVSNIDLAWVPRFAFVATAVGAALVADFDRENEGGGLAPVMMAMTALGVYATVPDTEQAAVLVGAALPIALLGWPKPLASLGAPGAFATVGLVVWTASVGGQGRPGAVVGAIACLGVMLVEPLVRRVFVRRRPQPPRTVVSMRVVLVAGLHGGLVLFMSLAAGREVSGATALTIALVAYVGVAIALALVLFLDLPRTRVPDS
jgi:hypothetical protein